jgi:amidophosphoribosyltransferase
MGLDQIPSVLGVDSLGFLSIKGIKTIAQKDHCKFCTGCFTGIYPIDVPQEIPVDKFSMKIGETAVPDVDWQQSLP